MTNRSTAVFAFLLLSASFAGERVLAHAVINEATAIPGQFAFVTLRITHGCGRSATTELRLKIPEGVTRVSARHSEHWRIEKRMRALDVPFVGEGGQTISETVDEIIWIGGELPDGFYGEFQLRVLMPRDPGRVLWFPTVQICADGEIRWTDIPESDDQNPYELESPAPFVRLASD